MNGWDPDIMDLIINNCINPGYDCSVGLLGDGTRLEEVDSDDKGGGCSYGGGRASWPLGLLVVLVLPLLIHRRP